MPITVKLLTNLMIWYLPFNIRYMSERLSSLCVSWCFATRSKQLNENFNNAGYGYSKYSYNNDKVVIGMGTFKAGTHDFFKILIYIQCYLIKLHYYFKTMSDYLKNNKPKNIISNSQEQVIISSYINGVYNYVFQSYFSKPYK